MKKLLFFAILFLIFSSCSNEDCQKLLEEQSRSQESAYELIDKDLKQLKKEIFYLLSDDAKSKHRPIGSWIENNDGDFSKAYNWIHEQEALIGNGSFSWSEKKSELDSLLKELKSKQEVAMGEVMNNHGKTSGLKENEILEWIAEAGNKLSVIDTISTNLLSYQKASTFSKTILTNVKLKLKVLEKRLVGRMGELIGGRGISCNFGIFPRVFSNQNIVKRGEVFMAEIVMHPYDHGIFLSDLEVKVNGEIVDFSVGRYMKYTSEPILEKQKTITITGKRRNEISGKFEIAFPDYEYIINTVE